MTLVLSICLCGLFPFFFACKEASMMKATKKANTNRPNVILVMTDNYGIGDLGVHGNPWIKTPNIDAFYQESVRLAGFHVSPMGTSRAALITRLYPINKDV